MSIREKYECLMLMLYVDLLLGKCDLLVVNCSNVQSLVLYSEQKIAKHSC